MIYESVGGCTSKVDAEKLVRLLDDAGLPIKSGADFMDAHVMALPTAATNLAISVDLIYDPGLPPADFGWIAAAHAMSDIYASLATPMVATVCLGATREQVESGHAASVLRGTALGLASGGTALVGGHTVYAERPFVAVNPLGVHRSERPAKMRAGDTYELWLSKPIGNGIRLAAHREGIRTLASDDIAVRLMKRTNVAAATLLMEIHSEAEDLGFVTDVSGFGLVGAITNRVPDGWTASLDAADVPLLDDTKALISEHAVFTNLGETNMFWAQDSDQCDTASVSAADLLALCDPQTSGGLLAAVRPTSAERLRKDLASDWTCIGLLEQLEGGSQAGAARLIVR